MNGGKMGSEAEFIKFESINIERADDIAKRYVDRDFGVTRAEVVLTNRCQLKCAYCKKQLEMSAFEKNVDYEVMYKTLENWLDRGCRFLHFTGGEVSLNEHLGDYVELCAQKGAEVTMSTNGVNDLACYEELVRRGTNCFHISLDTYKPEVFDEQVGVPGAFDRVIETIKLIVRMRDEENYHTRLVLNVCITPATFDDIVGIAEFMISLKPNDIKLIPISQLKDSWGEYEGVYEEKYKPKLLSMVPEGEGFVMFKSRINSLVKKKFRGYNDKRAVPPCYLSQDERTIDPEGNYYGCYINYREGAKPIGNIKDDSFIVQSEKLRKHMMNFTNSEICQRYCADLTVACNKYIDEKILKTDKSIFRVSGDVNVTASEYGNKAYVIERLYEEGIRVPKSLYLRSSFLEDIFIKQNEADFKKYSSSLSDYDMRNGVTQWITGLPVNKQLLKICEEFIISSSGDTFVVRSSSNLEDSNQKSYAGVFESILNIKTPGEMAEAVCKVFVSRYSYMVDNPEGVTMGAILENQVKADCSGVAFSINPVTGESDILLTYSEGPCELVVSGHQGFELTINRDGEIESNKNLPHDLLLELRETIIHIEKILNGYVDVEWAVENGKLYILQARKMTAWKSLKKISNVNRYVDSLNREELDEIDFGPMAGSHRKYMGKHFRIRKAADEGGIRFPEVGYLFYNTATLTQQVFDSLVPKALIYKVVTEIGVRTLSSGDIVPFLKSIGNEDGIARIQKITITTACGNISTTSDGNIYVEYMPGGFGGFMEGRLPFSHYLLDSKGHIKEKEEKEYDRYWKFNEKDKRFIETKCKKAVFSLSPEILRQAVELAEKCEKIFDNPRIEWELEHDRLYLNDISFESHLLQNSDCNAKVLSPGSLNGEIRVLSDMGEVKKILKNRSIVAESTYYKAKRTDAFRDYLARHAIDVDKKYIFISNYADPSMSLFTDYSQGYVFEEGGILSHMGIILREQGIPAIIRKDAMSKYKDGDFYFD